MKRLVTIQDISCIGKCSLTVALPVISAMGVEAAVIPTAVLSTHTAFSDFTFFDLTCEIEHIAEHFKKEHTEFSCIYTGYLGSKKQLDIVSRFISDFRKDAIVIIDPVMGDFGKLYSGFDKDFVMQMRELCKCADVILPNLTEACFLLDIPYPESTSEDNIKEILIGLSRLGAKNAVLTGVTTLEGKIGVMSYNSESNKFFSYYTDKIDAVFHGTGDIFASVCAGAICRGSSLEKALTLAARFTSVCIQETLRDPDRRWYGVSFERALPWLISNM